MYWLQKMADGAIGDLTTMLNARVDRVTKMKTIIDARDPILLRSLCETPKRAPHF
jgi:hypothetical protein